MLDIYNSESIQNFKNTFKFLNVIYIKNDDFKNGTYRIKKSGKYVLSENITFEPNNNIFPLDKSESYNCELNYNLLDNFHPTTEQLIEEDEDTVDVVNKYPKNTYQFGFLAAITIEADDVELDLNGYTIKQSNIHHIQQRFFTVIQLNKSPFIHNQGPANFGSITFPKNIYIHNGTIGKSSHHSILGNGNKNIIIEKINLVDYEVGGIALNGSSNTIIDNVHILNSLKKVEINFLYSNALYTRRFLNEIRLSKNETIDINGEVKDINNIICNLQMEMMFKVLVPLYLQNNFTIPTNIMEQFNMQNTINSDIFINKELLPEGNIYGIVLNKLGVVINDFIETFIEHDKNKNILIKKIHIKNLDSNPKQILAICGNGIDTDNNKVHKGAVGNVIPYELCLNDDYSYKPNVATNATFILAKYLNSNTNEQINSKTIYVPDCIFNWVKGDSVLDNNFITNHKLKYINLRDQMFHYMKGNICLFISGASNVILENINIFDRNSGVINDYSDFQKNHFTEVQGEKYPNKNILYKDNYIGHNLCSISIVSSKNININNVKINLLKTPQKLCTGVQMIGNNQQIILNNIEVMDKNNTEEQYYYNYGYIEGCSNLFDKFTNYLNSQYMNKVNDWNLLFTNINNFFRNQELTSIQSYLNKLSSLKNTYDNKINNSMDFFNFHL